jgi:phosphotransferase system enzyme I (PtsP)
MIKKLLTILKNISEIIAENNDSDFLLKKIVFALKESLNVDVVSIYVYNSLSETLSLQTTNDSRDESVKIPIDHGLIGLSFTRREVLNISLPKTHPNFSFVEGTKEDSFDSLLIIPLMIASSNVGVLVIQKKEKEVFENEVIETLKALSPQLASIILNANILDKLTTSTIETEEPIAHEEQVIYKGKAVSNNGVVIGNAFIFESNLMFDKITKRTVSQPEHEVSLLDKAIELTKVKTLQSESKALELLSEVDASIFYVHLLFLDDNTLINKIKSTILQNSCTVEYSIIVTYNEYKEKFLSLKDEQFKDRISDLKDTLLRLMEVIRLLRNGETVEEIKINNDSKFIIFSSELLPSDLIKLPLNNIAGIVCEKGGLTSHVAILSKALGIPTILGVKSILKQVMNDEEIILDCDSGMVYISPHKHVIEHFNEIIEDTEEEVHDNFSSVTLDGLQIGVKCNISLISEIPLIEKYNLDGVGLYRTEFLFMMRGYLPSEEEQFKIFSDLLTQAKDKEVTIRVLDAGADKPISYINTEIEENPALGNRGIRLLLSKEEILIPHLKAIIRASEFGKLRLMLPMVSSIDEVLRVKEIIKTITREFDKNNIKYDKDFQLGIMIEVPSVIFNLDKFAKIVDFVSIGSNDLFQYIFATDRGNENVSTLYKPLDPCFILTLKNIADTMKKYPEKTLSICGEMAGNKYATPLLIGAGIYDLSMAPKNANIIKQIISNITTKECQDILEKAISLNTHDEVLKYIKKIYKEKNI